VRGEAGNESAGCRCRSGRGEVGEGEETVTVITEKKRPRIDDGSDRWGRLVRLAGGLHPLVGKLETGVTVSVRLAGQSCWARPGCSVHFLSFLFFFLLSFYSFLFSPFLYNFCILIQN
jgi:hypothetical protein